MRPSSRAAPNPFRDNFPGTSIPIRTSTRTGGGRLQSLTQNGELVVPPGKYFMLGDNRNHSRFALLGTCSAAGDLARPLVIYFSLERPSTTDVQQAADDRLGHDRELSARLAGFARWKRIFHVVH